MNIITELTDKAITKAQSMIGIHAFKYRDEYHYVPKIYGKSAIKLRDIREDPVFFESASKVIQDKRTFLYYDRLYTLYQSLKNVANNNPLNICEVGVYKGGSSYFIADSSCKLSKYKIMMYSIDTFEGHDERDIKGKDGLHAPEGFNDTDYSRVYSYLSKFSFIRVIKGRVQDVTVEIPKDTKFHLIHLDVDLYEPYVYCLNFFSDRMERGSIIVCDDYGFKTCPGAKEAIDKFLQERTDFTFYSLDTGQFILIKK